MKAEAVYLLLHFVSGTITIRIAYVVTMGLTGAYFIANDIQSRAVLSLYSK